ncbi:hypothetical protein ACKLNR_005194 [Fusarium oxysporum f. sp. zingiberi]
MRNRQFHLMQRHPLLARKSLPGHQLEEQVEELKKPADRLLFLISEKRKMPHMKAHGVIGATQPETGEKPCRTAAEIRVELASKEAGER